MSHSARLIWISHKTPRTRTIERQQSGTLSYVTTEQRIAVDRPARSSRAILMPELDAAAQDDYKRYACGLKITI